MWRKFIKTEKTHLSIGIPDTGLFMYKITDSTVQIKFTVFFLGSEKLNVIFFFLKQIILFHEQT